MAPPGWFIPDGAAGALIAQGVVDENVTVTLYVEK
jgi:hypothetical protein